MSYFTGAPILRERIEPTTRGLRRRMAAMTPEQRRAYAVKTSLARENRRDTGRADARLRKF